MQLIHEAQIKKNVYFCQLEETVLLAMVMNLWIDASWDK